MGSTLDILLETFTWVGLIAGILLALVALVLAIADGTWLAAPAVLETTPEGRIARWFTHDGGVGVARLSAHDETRVDAGKDTVDLFYRRGRNRVRLTAHSPLVRLAWWLAGGFFGVGLLSFAMSLVILFVAHPGG